jgi:hypothetical protein
VEAAVLLAAVPLRSEHHAVGARHGPAEQVDVGFLAGLEDAELGVDRRAVPDDPVGGRLRAAAERLDVPVGAPALLLERVVSRFEVELEVVRARARK